MDTDTGTTSRFIGPTGSCHQLLSSPDAQTRLRALSRGAHKATNMSTKTPPHPPQFRLCRCSCTQLVSSMAKIRTLLLSDQTSRHCHPNDSNVAVQQWIESAAAGTRLRLSSYLAYNSDAALIASRFIMWAELQTYFRRSALSRGT